MDILNNIFWCMLESKEDAAIGALAEALSREPSIDEEQRRSLRLQQARAFEGMGSVARAEEIARTVATDPSATATDRWAAWCRIASVRMRTEDYPKVAEALAMAAQALPNSAETFRSLGAVYDLKLSRPQEALAAYARFVALGGKDTDVDERIRILQSASPANSNP